MSTQSSEDAKQTKSENGKFSLKQQDVQGFPSTSSVPTLYPLGNLSEKQPSFDPDAIINNLSEFLHSIEDLEREINRERNLAEIHNAGEAFEEKLPQLLRDSGKIEFLERFFMTSPYGDNFINGFIKLEQDNFTFQDTLAQLTKHEAKTAPTLMHFRATNFCQSVVKTYWALKLIPDLKNIKEDILTQRKLMFSKHERGKITPEHKQFPSFLHATLKIIHLRFRALPENFTYLLQIRCRRVAKRFPHQATLVASDLFFLRILNPYLVDSNGVDQDTHKDLVQITRGIQKVANGESFSKNEEEELSDSLDIVQMHRDFIKKIVSPRRYFSESRKQEPLIKA